MNHHVLDYVIALVWTLKHMPQMLRHSLECLLESLWFILLLNTNSRNIRHLANEDEVDPTGEFVVSTKSQLVPFRTGGGATTGHTSRHKPRDQIVSSLQYKSFFSVATKN